MRKRHFRSGGRNVRGMEVGSCHFGEDDGEDDSGLHGCWTSWVGDSRQILDAEM